MSLLKYWLMNLMDINKRWSHNNEYMTDHHSYSKHKRYSPYNTNQASSAFNLICSRCDQTNPSVAKYCQRVALH